NIRIHGITPDMVTDAPDFATVFPEVVAYVADQVLVAHNAQFDLTAFSRACHATGTPVPHWKFANIAVSAANTADASAQATQVSMIFLCEMNY
ncbi:exonuclease domain-containing protein, partial [uncultured Campylobacter sp.]|uniref:exonuclease domain-containing protein n=1 Tax=uncultured Campylobacter sp. TaxID=218934 RepID=UPI00262526F3